MRHSRTLIAWLVAGSMAATACSRGRVAQPAPNTGWIATWEAAPQLTEPRNLPPAPGLADRTIRQIIHVSLGGSRLRLRLSNEFGDGPIVIGAVHVGHSAGESAVAPGNVALRFGGSESVTIPTRGAVLSDPVGLRIEPLSNVAVSTYVVSMPANVTGHPGSRTTSYIVPGNHAGDERLLTPVSTEHWYILNGLQVVGPAPAASIVVLGNSIADGRGSGTDKNDRWPDNLARLLQANARTANVGVLNAGIGGNKILAGGLGPTALSRFERDVLAQPGAHWLIVSEGVNDLGEARGLEGSMAVARGIIDAYREFATRAHEKGMKAYGATVLPFTGSQYGGADHETARTTVNEWIRTSGVFDGVIDFDLAMRDPAAPSRLRSDLDSGDHLHPNEKGYVVMAKAIDLDLFADHSR